MDLQWAESAQRHGVGRVDILYAIAHAVLHHPGHVVARSADHGEVDLFIGPTRAGVVIEVLVERWSSQRTIIFHAMAIDERRLLRMREMRRNT